MSKGLPLARSLSHHRPSIVNQSSPREIQQSPCLLLWKNIIGPHSLFHVRVSPVLSSGSSLHSLAIDSILINRSLPTIRTDAEEILPTQQDFLQAQETRSQSSPLALTHNNDRPLLLALHCTLACLFTSAYRARVKTTTRRYYRA